MLDLDKSTWTRVKFGDVVKNANAKSTNPSSDGIDRVIAMEHLDPGELTVRRWGSLDTGTTFTRRVTPGQTMFGKRRAYQRKVAYAEFDAICSGDILTFEAITDKLLPELLPFIVQSDPFFEKAVGTSAGSLSPRTNWRDLAKFEFDLPPLDEQKRIADLMWAIQGHIAAIRATTDETLSARTAYASSRVSEMLKGASVDFSMLWSRSPESGWSPQPVDTITGQFVLSLSALGGMGYTSGHLKSVELTDKVAATRLKSGDVLISRANTNLLVGRSGIFNEERDDISFPDTMMRLHFTEDLIPAFAVEVINTAHGRGYMRRVAAGSATSMVKINRQSLGRLQFPKVDRERQANLLENLASFDTALDALKSQQETLGQTERSIQESIFGEL